MSERPQGPSLSVEELAHLIGRSTYSRPVYIDWFVRGARLRLDGAFRWALLELADLREIEVSDEERAEMLRRDAVWLGEISEEGS